MFPRRTTILIALAALPRLLASQEPALPGRLIAREPVAGDTAQHLAAYFPSSWDFNRRVPVLFVLDPRGRGELALRLFAGAAERHGWLVVSSYNSASDQPTDPNVGALNAMLDWSQANARIDTTRMYLAGFSGTSRVAWPLAHALHGKVAGIIGAGGAVGFGPSGPEMSFGADSSFAFFGTAGTTDFNYSEMRGFATRLHNARIPTRFAAFAGVHAWPPRSVAEQAVDWLELRAMLGGRRPRDSIFIARTIARDLAYADSLERAGQWDAAEMRYREVALDVPSLPEGRTALARADELASRDALRALRKRIRELEEDDAADLRREYLALASARGARSPLSPEDLLDKLGVASLRQRVASGDSLERGSAARRLNNVAAFISFYEPRAFLQQDQPLRAAVSLRAAASIAPLRGESCDLARRAAERLPPDEARRLPPCS